MEQLNWAEMKTITVPPTINLHSLNPCNYKCGFCYAGFTSARRSRIPQSELHEIIRQIGNLPLWEGTRSRKVTFAGGEPLLSQTAIEDIAFTRALGLVTSLVTNASLLTAEKIQQLETVLDWLTISIDSLDAITNLQIGRAQRGITLSANAYLDKIRKAQSIRIRTKINTVVNRVNAHEDFRAFILNARPHRWKIFQATRIVGENSRDFGRWEIDDETFQAFVSRHCDLSREGVVVVPETQRDIYGTYAMVGPNGCFFDNSQGTYRYSRPIVDVGIEAAWSEITFSLDRFRARFGDYDLATGLNRNEVAH
jgi:radical S-adenosyl methionine domain-containing protein 2